MKKNKRIESEYYAINKFVSCMLILAKYISLATCVIFTAIVMFLGLMLIMRGDNLPLETLTEAFTLISSKSSSDITNLFQNIGEIKVTIAYIAYSASIAISAGLLRAIFGKFKNIFNSIISGNMYDKTTLEDINTCVPLSILLTFVQPIIMCAVISTVGIFDYDIITISGIVFLAISYIGKLLIESGHDLYNSNVKLSKEISDIKAYESELKITALKKQAEAKKQEKSNIKKEDKKVTTKKTVKKEEQKKVEVKKTTPAKKITKTVSKKTTTK